MTITFALSTLANEPLKIYVVAIVGRCILPRLPYSLQRALRSAWGLVWPWAVSQDHGTHQDQSMGIAELKARVRELERFHLSTPACHPDELADSTKISDEKPAGGFELKAAALEK